jgi:hypothetical protein
MPMRDYHSVYALNRVFAEEFDRLMPDGGWVR